MDAIAAAEQRLVNDRLRQKLNEVNSAAQSLLAPVQDHVNFTLQKAYFKCAHECFNRSKTHDEISNCVENCSVPVLQAQHLVEGEMANFQERLNRSLRVCQDRFETAAKIQEDGAMVKLETCVDQCVSDSIKELPSLVGRLKTALSIPNSE